MTPAFKSISDEERIANVNNKLTEHDLCRKRNEDSCFLHFNSLQVFFF